MTRAQSTMVGHDGALVAPTLTKNSMTSGQLNALFVSLKLYYLHVPNLISIALIFVLGSSRVISKCADSLVAIPEHADPVRWATDTAMLKGLPSINLYALGDAALVIAVATMNTSILGYYLGGKMLPHRWWIFIPSFTCFFYVLVAYGAKNFMSTERSPAPIRMGAGFMMGTSVIGLAGLKYFSIPKEDPEKRATFRKLFKYMMQFMVVFLFGFYCSYIFATQYFFFLQTALQSISKGKNNLFLTGVSVLGEFFVVSAFFSLFIPVWQKVYAGRFILFTDTYGKFFELSEEELNDRRERTMFFVNYQIDAIRYVYGRGVLFKMSFFWMFIFLVIKDASYQYWHFGWKYLQNIVAMSVKFSHPSGKTLFTGVFAKAVKYVELFVKAMGIPRRLAASWLVEVDYRDTMKKPKTKETETDVKIGMMFANIKMVVKNVPKQYGTKLDVAELEAAEVENSKELGDALALGKGGISSDNPTTDAYNTILTSSTSPKGEFVKSQDRPNSVVMKMASEASTASQTNFARRTTTGVTNTFKFELPVDADDIAFSEGITDAWQTTIFLRYQARCAVKLAVSVLFLGGALVWQTTDTKHLPGIISPFEDYDRNKNYFAAGIIFLSTDLIEWFTLTRFVHLREARVPADRLRSFAKLLLDPWLRVACLLFVFYSGLYQVTATFDPYNPGAWQRNFQYSAEYQYKPEAIWPGHDASQVTLLLGRRIWDICAGRPTSNCVCDELQASCRTQC